MELPLPISYATNSYDLLADVKKAITEEPNRFYWSDWARFDIGSLYDLPSRAACGAKAPACGTLGCVKGWSIIVVYGRTAFDEDRDDLFPRQIANDLEKLFYARHPYNGSDEHYMDEDNEARYTYGMAPEWVETQVEYAARAVRAIDKFMSDFEQPLRAFTFDNPHVKGGVTDVQQSEV